MIDTTATLKTLFDLTGRVALVTGGSRGLGLQIAEALGEFGAEIVVAARKQDELDAAVAHLRGLGVSASACTADGGKPESLERLLDVIGERHGRLDILVNNAGASWGSPAEDMPLDAWNKLVAVNMTAPFLLAQMAAKRWMIPAATGRILNVASVEGLQGHPASMGGTIAYNTTKGGVINFTRALAAEWGPYGIAVNALAPGYFHSKMTTWILEKFGDDIVARTPRGRLGGLADLKGAALLLCSDAGAHITGQVLVVDGGATVI